MKGALNHFGLTENASITLRKGSAMKLYVAALLGIVFLENFGMYIVRGAVGSHTMAQSFCEDLRTKRIKLEVIDHYRRLNDSSIKAVLLTTKRGIKVCVPPELPWVKKIIRYLDQKVALAKLKGTTSPETVIG